MSSSCFANHPPRPSTPLTSERVRRVLRESMGEGGVTATVVAARLGTSLRTLHRHLAREGTPFGALLDRARYEVAVAHLCDQRLSIGEIARVLGFGRTSSFTRAFRRWAGCTPIEYRRRSATRYEMDLSAVG